MRRDDKRFSDPGNEESGDFVSTPDVSVPRFRSFRHRRAVALISAIAVLLVVAAFSALLLNVHGVQVSTAATSIQNLRAHAAALGGTHLALWKVNNDPNLQACLAQVIDAGDTAFSASPLFGFNGALNGASFHVDLWPGASTLRLKTTGTSGGVQVQRWAQMPCQLASSEQMLVSRDWQNSSNLADFMVKSSAGCAEYFNPALPGNAITWAITRVKVKIENQGGNAGLVNLLITDVDSNRRPLVNNPLATATIDVTNLQSYTWVQVPISVSGLTPGNGVAVVITSSSPHAYVQYDTAATNTAMAWCTSSGGAWGSAISTSAMELYVYGTVRTP